MKNICHSICWLKKTRRNKISPEEYLEENNVSRIHVSRSDRESLSENESRKKRQATEETLLEEENASRQHLNILSRITPRKKIQRGEENKSPNKIPQKFERYNTIVEAKSKDKSLTSIE